MVDWGFCPNTSRITFTGAFREQKLPSLPRLLFDGDCFVSMNRPQRSVPFFHPALAWRCNRSLKAGAEPQERGSIPKECVPGEDHIRRILWTKLLPCLQDMKKKSLDTKVNQYTSQPCLCNQLLGMRRLGRTINAAMQRKVLSALTKKLSIFWSC